MGGGAGEQVPRAVGGGEVKAGEHRPYHLRGGQKVAEERGVLFLGRIPLDPRICEDSDRGLPFVMEHPDSPAAEAFMEIVGKIEAHIKEKDKLKKQQPKAADNK